MTTAAVTGSRVVTALLPISAAMVSHHLQLINKDQQETTKASALVWQDIEKVSTAFFGHFITFAAIYTLWRSIPYYARLTAYSDW